LLNLIAEEEAGHLLQRNTEATLGLEMMQGKFGKAVDLALQKNALLESPFLFALAPFGNFPHFFFFGRVLFFDVLLLFKTAGLDVWRRLMKSGGEQLEARGEIHQAALFCLAVDDVHGAVRLYRRGEHFREAIALARLRLPIQDLLILELYRDWGRDLEAKSQFEQSAKWWSFLSFLFLLSVC